MEKEEKMALKIPNSLASPRSSNINSIPKFFWSRVTEWSDRPAMRQKVNGIWREITWQEYGQKAKYVALGLHALGLLRGDRLAIMSENNPEWFYSDIGTLSIGGVSFGIYPTDSPQQVAYVMGHSGAKFCIAENEEQLDKILEVREKLPALKNITVMDMEGLRHFSDPMVMSFEKLLELGRDLDQKHPDLFKRLLLVSQPKELAILIYTSGTTGPPKAAMISHENIFGILDAWFNVNRCYMTDEVLTYLPLCHIAERAISLMGQIWCGYVANFAEGMDTVLKDIREVSPTTLLAAPRIWEKFYSFIVLRMMDSTWVEKLAYKWSLSIGERMSDYELHFKTPPLYLKFLFKLADWAVLRNLRRFIGLNRIRYCISGTAPISPDLLKFYHGLGLDIREAYGQTETTGGMNVHYPGDTKFGTCGKPLPGFQIRIAEDGEILIKGPSVFMGYYNDPDRTAETIAGGWLYTGDIGRIDTDGHLIIMDRKKDIIITAGGKNITPSEIENQLKFSPYINDAIIIGDRRKYLTVLIMIDDENVMKFAQEQRIPFTTYASLTKAPEVIKLVQREVDKVNKKFSRVESIKKFRLIDTRLTEEDEELTPTMKLKRKFVSEKFKDLIESMY